jgi:hypothetical protein
VGSGEGLDWLLFLLYPAGTAAYFFLLLLTTKLYFLSGGRREHMGGLAEPQNVRESEMMMIIIN